MENQTKKINNDTNECIDNCDINAQYKYEYNGKCYENCSNGFLLDENNNTLNQCKCELDKCLICPTVALNNSLCSKCNTNYYPKENDPLNQGKYFNCYYQSEGYYLEQGLYKDCYYTCKKCDIKGNNITHNCKKCNKNFFFIIMNNNGYFNCYENFNYYNNIINNQINATGKSNEEEIKYYDNILKSVEDEFTSKDYDTSNLDNELDDIIKTEKMTITLSTYGN